MLKIVIAVILSCLLSFGFAQESFETQVHYYLLPDGEEFNCTFELVTAMNESFKVHMLLANIGIPFTSINGDMNIDSILITDNSFMAAKDSSKVDAADKWSVELFVLKYQNRVRLTIINTSVETECEESVHERMVY